MKRFPCVKRLLPLLTIILCVSVAPSYAREETIDKMERAVQEGDMAALKKELKKFDRECTDPKERTKALTELIVSCGEVQKRSFSILSDAWDFARVAGGAGIALYAAYYLVHYGHKEKITETQESFDKKYEKCSDCRRINCAGKHLCHTCKLDEASCTCGVGGFWFARDTKCIFCDKVNCYPRDCHKWPDIVEASEKRWIRLYATGSTFGMAFGLYQIYKGLRHSNQRSIKAAVGQMEAYLEHEVDGKIR